MKHPNATFEIVRTTDKQVILRGVYYGQKSEAFGSLVESFQFIANNFCRNHVFKPVGPPRIELLGINRVYFQVFDIVEESFRVDEILEWSRDTAQQLFPTPQQYQQKLNKNAV
ncbi:MAG: hypothetical protein M0Z31_05335 [Clostridia bacterium]|nr:hypothetical protein [Clostridia bacterium]